MNVERPIDASLCLLSATIANNFLDNVLSVVVATITALAVKELGVICVRFFKRKK